MMKKKSQEYTSLKVLKIPIKYLHGWVQIAKGLKHARRHPR